MHPERPKPISIDTAFESLRFLPDRTPASDDERWFNTLSNYRDGGIFVAHYAGTSQWERHRAGDEIVMVVDGTTTLILFIDGEEFPNTMTANEFLVVPHGVWHRFETPDGVKVMSVTPQPTDHRTDRPPDHES